MATNGRGSETLAPCVADSGRRFGGARRLPSRLASSCTPAPRHRPRSERDDAEIVRVRQYERPRIGVLTWRGAFRFRPSGDTPHAASFDPKAVTRIDLATGDRKAST